MRARCFVLSFFVSCALVSASARAQCPEEPPLLNFTGGGQVVCPCFIAGEEAGAVLTPPAGDLPIEVLRVGVVWASQFGGSPQSLEAAVKVYGAGLPNPGAPVQTLPGPVLTDGFINEYDLEPLPGQIVINSAPFSVTLEFLNDNSGDIFAPSVAHDGNGCQPGKNLVKAIPGGWFDACALGVTGDWVFYAVYRPVNCATDAEKILVSSGTTTLATAQPNPFRGSTTLRFSLERSGPVQLRVHDVRGRLIAVLAQRDFPAGIHTVSWDGSRTDGAAAAAGTYFVTMEAGGVRSSRKVVRVR
ncbi:MAG TPA: FlgD immunoglobulin-like domain containing protein [bacterium]|nr:FlgD immunoglobulin-like domain containing protein [bacterium]